jgi:hypothetical protein
MDSEHSWYHRDDGIPTRASAWSRLLGLATGQEHREPIMFLAQARE